MNECRIPGLARGKRAAQRLEGGIEKEKGRGGGGLAREISVVFYLQRPANIRRLLAVCNQLFQRELENAQRPYYDRSRGGERKGLGTIVVTRNSQNSVGLRRLTVVELHYSARQVETI